MTPESKAIIAKWTENDWYVYLRPMSGVYFGSDGAWWAVQVECRKVMPERVQGHGPDLDEVLKRLDLEVPPRPSGYVIERPGYAGWLAPARPQEPSKRPKKASGSRKALSAHRRGR